ncbi:OmpA family protein [Nocardioides sp. Iso805N]|uniref:OmpA family protein n=1 Tax=Nocardioides sp. Iso805N TaxID=1283287 RepID=UPI000372E470|nr:OmpA family protein [Nocardioides sp. Iso805N]
MLRITTRLRRSLGVAVAGCIAATGLTLALPVAAHAGGLPSQTIDFPTVPATPLSAGSVTAAATALTGAPGTPSGLSVSYASTTTGVCTTAGGSHITLVARGDCTIVASQDGDEDYAAAADVPQTFSVEDVPALAIPVISTQLLSTGSLMIQATSPSGGFIQYGSNTPDVCSMKVYSRRPAGTVRPAMSSNSSLLTFNKVGTCTVAALQYPDADHYWLAAGTVTRSFQIVAAKSALSLQVPAGVALSKHTATYKVTSSAAVENVLRQSTNTTIAKITTTSDTPSVCTVASASSLKLVKAGTCRVMAAQAGVGMVTKSFPVWGAPVIPAKGKTTQTVPVLGKGESDLRVKATPAAVCRVADGEVTLIAPGTCKIAVTDGAAKVRAGKVKVAFVKAATPSKQLKHGGKVLFAFDSAVLTRAAKKSLRGDLATLRTARTVIVYGNTYGPGKNSAHSRKLASKRAAAVVAFLKAHGVKAKAVTVAAAMENPVSKNPAKNRRADIYYTK